MWDRHEEDRSNCHIWIGAKNENGREWINEVLSRANEDGFYYQPRLDEELLDLLPAGDVWITTACVAGWKYRSEEEDALDSKMEAMHTDPNATEEDQKLYKEFKKDRSAAEKFANENARSVLPNAAQTNFTVTMNARELLHFFSLRCCNRAQDEIRELASQMLVLCQQVAPNIFDNAGAPCVSGKCPEGKMSCGHPQKAEV